MRNKALVALWALMGVQALLLIALVLRAFLPPPAPATSEKTPTPASPEVQPGVRAYRTALPSIVVIVVDQGKSADNNIGGGVIINNKGEILTALHVVQGASSIDVYFYDGTKAQGKIVEETPEKNIARLEVDALPETIRPAIQRSARTVQIGEEVYAVGHPAAMLYSISAGVVSGLNRTIKIYGEQATIDGLIQFSAPIDQGSSGGPLLDRGGRVIGIVIGGRGAGLEYELLPIGMGFAVPIDVLSDSGGGGH